MAKGRLNNIEYLSSQSISSASIQTGTFTLIGNTISGLTDPTFPSAAANKNYVDTISSNNAQNYYPSSLGNSLNSSYAGHSGNSDVHFTVLSGLTNVSSATPTSGQSLVFDGTIWKPSTVSGQGAGSLSQLTIDANKYWSDYGISGLGYISSAIISGGHITTTYTPVANNDVLTKQYGDANYGGGSGSTFWVYPQDIEVPRSGTTIKFSGQGGTYVYSGQNTIIISSTTTGGNGTSYWSSQSNGIYYNAGEVKIGPSGQDFGDYRFQVSGGAYLSGNVVFRGNMISGITVPTYNSGVSNKKYVDDMQPVLYIYPANSYVPYSGNSTVYFSGQSGTYIYSSNNTIIISSAVVSSTPYLTFNMETMYISSMQTLTLTKFTCPASDTAKVWQAAIATSSNASVSGLLIEILSGSTSVYSTSANTLQSGSPLATTNGGPTEIRIKYSGTGVQYCTGFMNITVD
jgi:hypothetical protein